MAETAAIQTYADYQKYNFFRTPDWRWERVLNLVDRKGAAPGRCTRRDDDVVKTTRAYVLKRRNGDAAMLDRLKFENPGLNYAYDFNLQLQGNPNAAMYVQARLLAKQTPEQIGHVMGLMPDAINWYSKLFFDVVPYLEQRDWITDQILIPAIMRSTVNKPEDVEPQGFKDSSVAKPFLDGTLKLFAYFGGTHLVDLMISGLQAGKPLTSPDDVNNWLDNTIGVSVRRRTAQAAQVFEINKYNVMELFAVHSRIMELDRSEDNQDQARTTTERHIKAMVDDIPWAIGSDGEKLYGQTIVGRFDNMSSELRDDELILMASGQHVKTVARDNFPERLPEPRKDKKSVLMTQDADI